MQDEILMDYAAGTSSEPEAVFVAAHLALCPQCRRRIEELEEIGGAFLESVGPAECGEDAFDALMARIDAGDESSDEQSEGAPITARAGPVLPGNLDDATARIIPRPLRDYLDQPISALPWKSVMRGLDEVSVPIGEGDSKRKARLLRIRAGTQMPKHTHAGSEMTIVLSGSFSDERGAFGRGDVAIHDDDVDHQPVAGDEEDCLCFVVTDAPLKLTGRFTRFLNPFVKF
ncbi:ChrR family anti-sigma-E factor [Fodinicurvata sp. EGI_FJ10296]|uniref:ChrR family anti-sigma-E factor n=1 Tax=Fodinicurvata sp. EGI_FJ10296 TaxID=3231908 RepID=UPI003452EA85